MIKSICHEDDKHFVVNTHALHNATLLRQFLPRSLTKPMSLYDDREARHHNIAATLWITQAEKRARTAAKWIATQDAKKKARPASVDEPEAEEAGEGDEEVGSDTNNEGGRIGDVPVSDSEITQRAGAQKRRCI
jgi:hypothetical protein